MSFSKWRLSVVFVACSAVTFSVPELVRAQDHDPTLRQIMSDWQRRQESISSVRYTAAGKVLVPKGTMVGDDSATDGPTTVVPPEDYTFEKQLTLLVDFENNRVRKETHTQVFHMDEGHFHPTFRIELFDGSNIQVYDPREANTSPTYTPPEYQPEIRMKTDSYFAFFIQESDFPLFFGHGIFPSNQTTIIPRRVRVPLDPGGFQVHGRAMQDGRECVILRTARSDDKSDRFYELWVDLERESAVSRWISYKNGRERSRLDVQYHETPYGWLLAGWTAISYYADGSLAGSEKSRVTEFAVNPEVDEKMFRVEPKPGMIIYDPATDTRYKVGAPGEPNVDVEQLFSQSRSANAWRWPSVVVASTLCLGVFGIGLVVLRRFKRDATP